MVKRSKGDSVRGFEAVFSRVIDHEGLFQNDKNDRGNWTSGKIGVGDLNGTKYGISAMSYPHLDIKSLTIDDAMAIYRRDWWEVLKLDRFHDSLSFQIFDAAINHGMRAAIKMIQYMAGAKVDGYIGPATIKAVEKISREDAPILFVAARIEFYTRIDTFTIYGRGWMNRIAQNLKYIAEDN